MDAERVRAFSVDEGDGWEIKRRNMETKEERMAKLDAIQEKLKRVDEMLLGLNGIDEDAGDAVERYTEGLAMAMALQDDADYKDWRFHWKRRNREGNVIIAQLSF